MRIVRYRLSASSGQGKTLVGLQLLLDAARAGNRDVGQKVIRLIAMLYIRCPLSLINVEDLRSVRPRVIACDRGE
jgi:hypothetical protein